MKRPTSRRAKGRDRAAAKRGVLIVLRQALATALRWSRDGVYVGWARENRERARLLRIALAAVRKAAR